LTIRINNRATEVCLTPDSMLPTASQILAIDSGRNKNERSSHPRLIHTRFGASLRLVSGALYQSSMCRPNKSPQLGSSVTVVRPDDFKQIPPAVRSASV